MFCSTHALLCQEKSCIMVQGTGFSALLSLPQSAWLSICWFTADHFPEHYFLHTEPQSGVPENRRQTASVLCSSSANQTPVLQVSAWWEIKGQQSTGLGPNTSLESIKQSNTKQWLGPVLLKHMNCLENLLTWRFWFSRSVVQWCGGLASTSLTEPIINLSSWLCSQWLHFGSL